MSLPTPHELRPTSEQDHLPRRALVVTAVIALLVGAVGVLVAAAILRATSVPVRATPAARAPAEIGIVEQTLVASTRRGLDLKAEQRESLDHFGWVDRRRGIAQIPIERAMDLVTDAAFVRQAQPVDSGRPTPDAGVRGGT